MLNIHSHCVIILDKEREQALGSKDNSTKTLQLKTNENSPDGTGLQTHFVAHIQWNFNGSNTDGSFTTAVPNPFLSPLE